MSSKGQKELRKAIADAKTKKPAEKQLGKNWPMEKHGDVWRPAAYSPDSDWMVLGKPRCPAVTQAMIRLSDESGVIGPADRDHHIGQNPISCETCADFFDAGQKVTMYNYGSVWQWLKQRGLKSEKRPWLGATPIKTAADALGEMGTAAQGAVEAMKELSEQVQPDPEDRVPMLVKRRWIEEARRKKRRNA